MSDSCDKIIFDLGRPLIMAHRGDSASTPENTMLSMERAVEVGVDILETDVRMTSDGQLVLFHDDTLERTTGVTGRISDYTLEELKQIDVGSLFTPDGGLTYPFRGKGLTIVTLREAFERFPDMRFNLDIKDMDRRAAEALAEIINEYDMSGSVIVGSFHDAQIQRFRRLMPDVATAAAPSEVTKFLFGVKSRLLPVVVRRCPYRAFQVPVRYGRISVVDRRFVSEAHKRMVAVHVWTINDRETMEHLIQLGVDGIFTDNPRLLRSLLEEQGLL